MNTCDKEILLCLPTGRKISNWNDVPSYIDWNDLFDEFKEVIKKLPILDGDKLDVKDPFTSLNDPPQFFLITIKDRIFFVDTQGYDYCRYTSGIINYDYKQ